MWGFSLMASAWELISKKGRALYTSQPPSHRPPPIHPRQQSGFSGIFLPYQKILSEEDKSISKKPCQLICLLLTIPYPSGTFFSHQTKLVKHKLVVKESDFTEKSMHCRWRDFTFKVPHLNKVVLRKERGKEKEEKGGRDGKGKRKRKKYIKKRKRKKTRSSSWLISSLSSETNKKA